jgi:hypothetical protein
MKEMALMSSSMRMRVRPGYANGPVRAAHTMYLKDVLCQIHANAINRASEQLSSLVRDHVIFSSDMGPESR